MVRESSARAFGRSVQMVVLCLLVGACQVGLPGRVDVPTDPEEGEVAFDFAGPGGAALIVPVHVNGRGPYQFVLDTGATMTCIDQALVDTLELPQTRGALGFGAGATRTGRVRLVDVDSLRVGATQAHELNACVLDLEHIQQIGISVDGLLGLNFLRAFQVTLDFDRRIVRFQDPSAEAAAAPAAEQTGN